MRSLAGRFGRHGGQLVERRLSVENDGLGLDARDLDRLHAAIVVDQSRPGRGSR
jgi:hypothetical protein